MEAACGTSTADADATGVPSEEEEEEGEGERVRLRLPSFGGGADSLFAVCLRLTTTRATPRARRGGRGATLSRVERAARSRDGKVYESG